MIPPIRIGLLGCGRLAELGYLPALAPLGGELVLAAVADPHRGRRERLAALATAANLAGGAGGARTQPSVESFATAAELVKWAGVDALVIASPVSEHVPLAELASAHGLPSLVEKAPAPDLAGAERLAGLDPAPWIGFNRRFQHGPALLDRLPARADSLELRLELRYRRASWRPHAVRDDALDDLAPHLIDLALMLSRSTRAALGEVRLERERVELELELEHGRAAISCATDRPYRERVSMRCGGRRLARSAAGGPARALLTRFPGAVHPLAASLGAQLRAFAAALRGEDPGLLATAEDGVRVMRVIDAARRAGAAAPAAAKRPAAALAS